MKIRNPKLNKNLAVALLVAASAVAGVVVNSDANAAMNKVTVRFDRMATSSPTTGTVCATANTAGTVNQVKVTFPTGFNVSTTTSNWSTSTTNLAWPTGASAWPTIGATASSVSGQTVTWSSATLTTGTLYCFNWTNSSALTQPSSANANETGYVETNIETYASGNAGSYATATVTNDQIAVTATVPATFGLTLSANSDSFTLDTGSVKSSATPVTTTIYTNAKNGWNVWARNVNGKLTSALNSYSINTNAGVNSTLSAGTEGYNIGVTGNNVGNGTLTVATPFVGGATGKGGGLDATLRLLGGSTGASNGSTLALTNNIAISSLTPAGGDYSDTITVVGAGLF